ncbi:MAG: mycothione reductase [Actinobacteria bacterium]|nr:mycothione reductase [Actinomycetota bacterium]
MHFDLLIIGTGSGNSILTPEHESWRVGLVERGPFGGTCLNRGCVPSKMLVLPADLVVDAAEAQRLGVHFAPPRVDWPSIRERTFGRIDPIAADGAAYRRSQPNVTVLEGDARFVEERTVAVSLRDGTRVEVGAERIVLAAGASPVVPDIEGLAGTPFHTSDTIMRIDRLPRHLIVVGGGFIASELGHVFAAYGSQVTVVHRGPLLLSHEDGDVSRRFTEEFGRRVQLRLNRAVTSVEHRDGRFRVLVSPTATDASDPDEVIEGDALLITTGRRPNGVELGVDAAGVRMDDAGYVITDDTLRTDAAGIWAMGDIRNPLQLKHLANREAKVVSHNLLHPDDPLHLDERVVPRAVFSHPEVASVGAREEDLRARSHRYLVGRRDYGDVAYGWALEDRSGFAKVLVCATTDQILGGHVIGPQAATLVHQISQAMTFGIEAHRLATEPIWAHPALPEVLENALLDAGEPA